MDFSLLGDVSQGIQVGTRVPSGGEEAIGGADFVSIHQVPVLLGQNESEGGMVGMMGHPGKIGLPEVVDFTFDDQPLHVFGEHEKLLRSLWGSE
jgi:hypothetical protein